MSDSHLHSLEKKEQEKKEQGKKEQKNPEAFRTIGEVARILKVPQHVLRFWEKRFPHLKPVRGLGRRNYYRPEDIDLLQGIRHLLYEEGYTIKGVQKLMQQRGKSFVQEVATEGSMPRAKKPTAFDKNMHRQLTRLLDLLEDFRDQLPSSAGKH